MATWPTDLQQKLLASDFSLSSRDNVIRTDMDYGPAKLRRRYTKTIDDISCSIHLKMEQYNTFQSFYKTTIAGGTLPFDFIHPVTESPARARFLGPPRITPLGGRVFKLEMNWELLP